MEKLKDYTKKRKLIIKSIKTKPFKEVEVELKELCKLIPDTMMLDDFGLYQIVKDNFEGDLDYEAYKKQHTYSVDVGSIPSKDVEKYVKEVQKKMKI